MPEIDSSERVIAPDDVEPEVRTLAELVGIVVVEADKGTLSSVGDMTVIVVGDGQEGSIEAFSTIWSLGTATSVDTSRILVTRWSFLFGPSDRTVTVLKSVTVMTCQLKEELLEPPTAAVTVIVEGQPLCARTRAALAKAKAYPTIVHMAFRREQSQSATRKVEQSSARQARIEAPNVSDLLGTSTVL